MFYSVQLGRGRNYSTVRRRKTNVVDELEYIEIVSESILVDDVKENNPPASKKRKVISKKVMTIADDTEEAVDVQKSRADTWRKQDIKNEQVSEYSHQLPLCVLDPFHDFQCLFSNKTPLMMRYKCLSLFFCVWVLYLSNPWKIIG